MRQKILIMILAAVLMSPFTAFCRDYSVRLNNDNVEEVVRALKKETGYDFVYQKGKFNNVTSKFSGNFSASSLDQFLDKIIRNEIGLDYEIVDKTVILMQPKQTVSNTKINVTGSVFDNNGEPITGAFVLVKGTGTGAISDASGNFNLKNVPANSILQVNFIGYKTETVRLNGRNNIKIELATDQQRLDEVIVTGYQTISKERATGSFSVITPEKLEGKLQTGIMARLEGTVAGMKTVDGGTPEIRGVSTLNGTRTPLYVVDGIPYEGSLAAINPAEIVNVTVLKDATAASIYGARSANGVIVITTRSGETGKTKVSYNGSVKFTPLPDRGYLDRTNSAELVDLQETLFNNYTHTQWDSKVDRTSYNEVYAVLYDHENGYISDEECKERLDYYRGLNNYDQFKKQFVRSAQMVQQHNVSFSGGSGIYRYALSANYMKNYPYEKAQTNDRLGFNLKNTFDFFKWMRVNLGIIQSNTSADYDNGFTGYGYLNGSAPYKMLYNEDGTPTQWYNGKNQDEIDRLISLGLQDESYFPALEQNKAHYRSTSKYQNINLTVRFTILNGLSLDLMYQTENTDSYSKQYYTKDSQSIKSTINNASVVKDGIITNHIPIGGRLAENWGENKSYTMRAQLNFNRQFGEMHDIQAIAGTERRKVTTHGSTLNKWGYDDTTLAFKSINELNLGQQIKGTEAIYGSYSYSGPYDTFYDTDNRYVSFYANASYTFDRRLTASGSIRVDKSNLFGTDPKYQNKPLWSVGLQYLTLRNWNWIDRLSLRGTYGINGNVAKQSGPYLIAKINSRPNYYTNDYYSDITTPPNPALRWEKTKVINFGADFNLLHNRLNGSIEYYSKNTDDLLGQRQTDPTCGWSSLLLNYGSMYNRGIELSLSSINIANRDFEWTSNLVFAYNKNKLTRIENSGTSAYSYFSSLQNREGKPMASLWSVRYAGLDEEGFPTAYKKDGTIVKAYNDLEADDLVYSGTTNPPYNAALTNRLTYKGISLEFMFVFYGGHKLRDVAASYVFNRMPTMNYASVVDRDRLHFWQKPGDENDPDMAPNVFYGSKRTSSEQLWSAADKHIEKGDYIKLRNLIIGYSFPKKLINKAYLQNLRVDLQIQNLFYWAANKRNLDPEVWSGTTLTPSRGTHIPPTYTIGLSANF